MYTSVITDQIDENLETALRIARLHGYTHVELHNVFGKSIEECSPEEVDAILSLLGKYDMKVSCIASTVFFLCTLMKNDKVSLFNPSFHAIEGDVGTHLRYLKNAWHTGAYRPDYEKCPTGRTDCGGGTCNAGAGKLSVFSSS